MVNQVRTSRSSLSRRSFYVIGSDGQTEMLQKKKKAHRKSKIIAQQARRASRQAETDVLSLQSVYAINNIQAA